MPEEGGCVSEIAYPIPLVLYEGCERVEELLVCGGLGRDAILGEIGVVGVRLEDSLDRRVTQGQARMALP